MNRRGYTLTEVILVVAILLIIGAVIIPTISQVQKSKDIKATADALAEFAEAVQRFFLDTQHYAGFLTHFSSPITTSMRNSCSDTYPAGAVGKWAGPYVDRLWGSNAIRLEIGLLQDSLIYVDNPQQGGGANALQKMIITDVLVEDAEAINSRLDGDVSNTEGTIQWSLPPVDGRVTMYYVVPIKSC